MSLVPIGVTSAPFKEDLRDRFERGFQYVELRMSETLLIGRRVEIAGELERSLDEYDLEVISIHVPEFQSNGQPVDFISPDEQTRTTGIELVEAAIRVASAIGAPRVVVTLPPFITSQQTRVPDPTKWLTLVRHRLLTRIKKFVERADQERLLFCLKNAPPIGPGPAGGDFFGLATLLEVQGILKRLSEYTRAWIAFDVANAHLFSNAWAAAREGYQNLAWIERLGIEVPMDIKRTMGELAELTEIFYVSNVRGFAEKGLLPEEGELDFETLYRQVLTCIFPERTLVIDVQEKHEEQAVNAELMFAYLREIAQKRS